MHNTETKITVNCCSMILRQPSKTDGCFKHK